MCRPYTLQHIKQPDGQRKIKRVTFAEVGGPVYHLQTSITVDLAVTLRTQLCLAHYQCGPLRVKVYLLR